MSLYSISRPISKYPIAVVIAAYLDLTISKSYSSYVIEKVNKS